MIARHSSDPRIVQVRPYKQDKAMTNRKLEPLKSARRRLEVEKNLAGYPHLSPDEIINLVH